MAKYEQGFLADLVKGECEQVHSNGVTKTTGNSIFASSADTPVPPNTAYHYPSYGRINKSDGKK